MKRIERRIDVSAAADLGMPLEMAVSIVLPDQLAPGGRPVAMFAAPGGGYTRGYFDLHFPGHENYSEAEYHARRGMIHVAIDHVGVGGSTIPDLGKITLQTMAATHDLCVRKLVAEIEAGTLDPGLPPRPDLFRLGTGQSMGGACTVATQARFGTFHAIAPCGQSITAVSLAQPDGTRVGEGKVGVGPGEWIAKIDLVYPFHWEDVPPDVLAVELENGFPVRHTQTGFGSLTVPPFAAELLRPGYLADDAAAITVPVFIGMGERDTCADPHVEPARFAAANDVALAVIPRMAHMHNFSPSRMRLWQRMHDWARLFADAPA